MSNPDPKVPSEQEPFAASAAATGETQITKGRFKVKHIKSDDGAGGNSTLVAPPQGVSRVPSSDGNASGPETSGSFPSNSQDPVVPKKSRFIVKTRSAKDDERPEGLHDSAPAAAVRASGSAAGTNASPSAGPTDLVRVPSGSNLALSHKPIPSAHQRQAQTFKEDQIEKIFQVIDMNNRLLRELMGGSFPPSDHSIPPSTTVDVPVQSSHSSLLESQTGHLSQLGTSVSVAPSPDITATAPGALSHPVPATGSITSTPTNIGPSNVSSVPLSISAERAAGDKCFAKLSHYVSEMKKELDGASKVRRDNNIEIQRLREKCQQLEDRVTAEHSRNAQLEERLERSQLKQKNMAAQIEALQQQLAAASNGHVVYMSNQSQAGKVDSVAPVGPSAFTTVSNMQLGVPGNPQVFSLVDNPIAPSATITGTSRVSPAGPILSQSMQQPSTGQYTKNALHEPMPGHIGAAVPAPNIPVTQQRSVSLNSSQPLQSLSGLVHAPSSKISQYTGAAISNLPSAPASGLLSGPYQRK